MQSYILRFGVFHTSTTMKHYYSDSFRYTEQLKVFGPLVEKQYGGSHGLHWSPMNKYDNIKPHTHNDRNRVSEIVNERVLKRRRQMKKSNIMSKRPKCQYISLSLLTSLSSCFYVLLCFPIKIYTSTRIVMWSKGVLPHRNIYKYRSSQVDMCPPLQSHMFCFNPRH